MRILLSSLCKYVDLTETPEEIAAILTAAGLEVDGFERLETHFKGVVAARVMKAAKHPNADKLTLAEVFDGKTTHTLVCGAPNCREGMITALAPLGALLYPDGLDKPALTIQKVILRGVESSGMLCAADELGLTTEAAGIVELEEVDVGTSLDTYFNDIVFEISLTPNLGHCMSVLGIARELAALTGRALKKQPWQSAPPLAKDNAYQITIENKELCPRYSALSIKGVKVAPSPLWLALQLQRCGLNSVNNIVDAGNWIAHELGQPLHAFDAATFENNHIVVRAARGNETASFLDGVKRELPAGSCVITNNNKVIALGGVLGEATTSVSDTTDSLFVES